MTLSRRTIVRGSIALSASLALSNLPGLRLIRAQGAAYDLVDLGYLGTLKHGNLTVPGYLTAINAAGAVAGVVATSTKYSPATWSTAGKLKRYKTGKFGGMANALNSAGLVVGAETVGEQLAVMVPAMWQDGDKHLLPFLADSGDGATGYAIDVNDSGVIVGSILSSAIRWTDGEPETLPAPDGADATRADAINTAGLILGTSQYTTRTQDGDTNRTLVQQIPTIWVDGTPTVLRLPKSVSDWAFFATNLDDAGRVLVTLSSHTVVDDPADRETRSYLYENGKPTRVAGLTEDAVHVFAAASNSAGQVVGYSGRKEENSVASIWFDGEPTDLNSLIPSDSGLTLINAVDINEDGSIAATALDDDQIRHGVLLVPAS